MLGRKIQHLIAINLAIILLVLVGPNEAFAHYGDQLSGYGTATIDGKLSAGEWDSAAEIPVFAGELSGSTLFVMNDEKNLYIALSVVDDTLTSDDHIEIRFDNSHNGILDLNDDTGGLSGLVTIGDGYFDGENYVPDSNTHGVGATQNDGTRNFIEYSKPLDTGDANDFNLSIGDTVGFCITYFKDGTAVDNTQFGPACRIIINEQNLYGHILLISSGVDASVDSVQKEDNKEQSTNAPEGGGCLIATATFGTELASQVQTLREIRDNILFRTISGTTFMTGFNHIYYSFSPTIADYEREYPAFKEVVKTTITPLLTTLSILNYVDVNSEEHMIGYGIGIILLNIGMYFVAPLVFIIKIKHRFNHR